MENAKPSSSPPLYSGGAGAGGKFRKPPVSRKRPSTPYDRPSRTTANNESVESQDGGGGWLSKLLVNPARRLIVDGAARMLPSFFSKSESESSSADEYEDDSSGDLDNKAKDATLNACGDAKQTLELGVSGSSRDEGPSNERDKMKGSSEHTYVQQDKSKKSVGDLGLDQIENLLKGKRFSRDESNRLMEILNSRLVDALNTEGEKKAASVVSQGLDKSHVLDREIPMGKLYDFETAVLETPMPRVQSNMQDEVAASPIDIAKAYMGGRASELGISTYSNIPTDRREQQCNDLLPSKPNFLTPSLKSSTCWPGAMVQDQRGYLTPQNQRGRYGLHNFPRTPYSRTIYSRTKPKVNQLHADSKPSPNVSLSSFSQSRTTNPWQSTQVKTSNDVMDAGYGSVGPIRRVRNKFASEQTSFSSAKITSSSSVSRSFVPVFQKNQGNAGTTGTLNLHKTDKREQTFKGETNANPTGPSNETVRKILEQLDRHKPTPKEKAAELKLATEWKRSPPQDTNLMPNRSVGEGMDSGINFKGPVIYSNKPSNSVDDGGAGSSIGFKNTGVANEKSTVADSKGKEKSQPWSFDNQPNGQEGARKRPSHPILKPISFNRPDPQQVISHDNGRGFTFPLSAAAASSASEPPTPSIMPSFPAPQSKELPVIPTYSFGTKKSGERVVFSFPSTSSAPVDGTSDLKFNFGSDKKRVSFGLIVRDPIVIK